MPGGNPAQVPIAAEHAAQDVLEAALAAAARALETVIAEVESFEIAGARPRAAAPAIAAGPDAIRTPFRGLSPAAAERAFLTRYREILVEGRYAKYGWYKEAVSRVVVPTVAADVAPLADDNGADDEQTDPGVTVAPTECEELDND